MVDKRPHLLPLLDAEIGLHLQKALCNLGLKVMGNQELDKVVRRDGDVEVQLKDGTKLHAEMVLYALGREAECGRSCDPSGRD